RFGARGRYRGDGQLRGLPASLSPEAAHRLRNRLIDGGQSTMDILTKTPARRSPVRLLDLQAQYRAIEPEVMEALRDVCARQQFILGPRVAELEAAIADYSGCRHGVGISSGTDALLAALMALEVGPGDEVITTAFSFFATAGTVARLGARPLFADIDPTTYNLSPAGVEDRTPTQNDTRAGQLATRKTGVPANVPIPAPLRGQ